MFMEKKSGNAMLLSVSLTLYNNYSMHVYHSYYFLRPQSGSVQLLQQEEEENDDIQEL